MTTKKKREKFVARQKFSTLDARIKIKRHIFAADGDKPAKSVTTLTGYPIIFNQLSSDRGGYVVRIAPGAATFSKPTMALFHHDFQNILGNTANGTLRIGEADDVGVPIEIDLPNTQMAKDVAELVEQGYVGGMSFSMANGFEEFTEAKENDQNIINCTKFTCDEVTITGIPAFTGTSIEKQSDDEDADAADEEQASADAPARKAASLKLNELRLSMHR